MQRSIGDHHPTGVDSEMAREAVESVTDVVDEVGGEPRRQLHMVGDGLRVASVEILGQSVDLSLGEPEGLANILQDRTGPISDDVRHHGRPLPPIALVAVLDHFFATFGFEIDIALRSTGR